MGLKLHTCTRDQVNYDQGMFITYPICSLIAAFLPTYMTKSAERLTSVLEVCASRLSQDYVIICVVVPTTLNLYPWLYIKLFHIKLAYLVVEHIKQNETSQWMIKVILLKIPPICSEFGL